MERYNDNPIALSEGKVFVDGVQILDGVKFWTSITAMISVKCRLKYFTDRENTVRYLIPLCQCLDL